MPRIAPVSSSRELISSNPMAAHSLILFGGLPDLSSRGWGCREPADQC